MKKTVAILLCLVLLVSAAACSADAPQVSEPVETTEATEATTEATEPTEAQKPVEVVTEEVKAKLDAVLAENKFEGIVYLTHNGEAVYQSVSGTNDMGEPLTIDSAMYIGSVSKQFCATAILILRDQGKLSVDDTLDKYFPEYEAGKGITIKNLLTMRSGIKDFTKHFRKILLGNTGNEALAGLKEWAFNESLNFEPNEGYEYSNTNFLLLALIVEQVSGQSYEQFVRQNIFEPLGMTHSGFVVEVRDQPAWADGLTYDTFAFEADVPEIAKGAGDIVSTAADMDAWMTGLSSGKVISMDSYREMTTNYSADFATRYGYGIAGMVQGGFGHTGNIGSYVALDYFNAESGYNLFMVNNQANLKVENLAKALISELLITDDASEAS